VGAPQRSDVRPRVLGGFLELDCGKPAIGPWHEFDSDLDGACVGICLHLSYNSRWPDRRNRFLRDSGLTGVKAITAKTDKSITAASTAADRCLWTSPIRGPKSSCVFRCSRRRPHLPTKRPIWASPGSNPQR